MYDTCGESLYDSGFTDTRFTNQDRVVLLTSAQNLHHALDLILTAYDRIQFAFFGQLGQIPTVFIQGRRLFLTLRGLPLRLPAALIHVRSFFICLLRVRNRLMRLAVQISDLIE